MPLLAYCIAEAGAKIEVPRSGVQAKSIQTVSESGLVSFISDYSPAADRVQVRGVVLEFNRVLQQLLRQAAIVPFRFPTVVADESEMHRFLREHAEEYLGNLHCLQDAVQMEINLNVDDSLERARLTGAQYLRARQARRQKLAATAASFRKALLKWAKDWREHESSGGTRCYLLISRDTVPLVLQELKSIQLEGDLHARVTGPWPATEFLTEESSRSREKS